MAYDIGIGPRVFFLSDWSGIWPHPQQRAHAYHAWGCTLAALPFMMGEPHLPDMYETLVDRFDPELLHLGHAYHGEWQLTYDFLRRRKENPKTKTVFTHGDYKIGEWHKLPPLVDIAYVHSPTFEKVFREWSGCNNIKCIPQGVDTTLYYPVDVEQDIDILYMGHLRPERGSRFRTILRVDKEFDDLWVGGSRLYPVKHPFDGGFNRLYSEWSCRAKIGLCLVPDEMAHIERFFSARLLCTMASGAFALATYTPGLEDWFTRGLHLDWHVGDDELIEKIHYWLEHDEERKKVARQGYEHVLQNYTLHQQIGGILRDLGYLTEEHFQKRMKEYRKNG